VSVFFTMASSGSDDDDDALAGLSLPTFGAPAGGAEDEDEDEDEAPSPPQPVELGAEEDGEEESEEEEEEEAGPTGVSAEQAFASNTMDSLELDPFRRAAGADVPDRVEAEATGEKGKKGKKLGYVAQVHRTHMACACCACSPCMHAPFELATRHGRGTSPSANSSSAAWVPRRRTPRCSRRRCGTARYRRPWSCVRTAASRAALVS
jgi:hypothetical protein